MFALCGISVQLPYLNWHHIDTRSGFTVDQGKHNYNRFENKWFTKKFAQHVNNIFFVNNKTDL